MVERERERERERDKKEKVRVGEGSRRIFIQSRTISFLLLGYTMERA